MIGDWNDKDREGKDGKIVRQYGLGHRNEQGDRLVHFCKEHDLVITNTFYQEHKRRIYTWKSLGDVDRNQINYILIKNRFKNFIKQVKTCPGADIDSEHKKLPGDCRS